jgi:hypothetical protein
MVHAVPDAELRLITCGGTSGHAKQQLSQQRDGVCPADRLMPESAGRKAGGP